MLTIPVDAPHPENAHKFIDFILDAQVAADITNYVSFANGNAASLELVSDDVKSDAAVYPSDEVMANLYVTIVTPPKYDRLRTRAWTKVKTGQ